VTPVEDEDPVQHPVQQLPPQAAHEPFGDGVRLGRPYRPVPGEGDAGSSRTQTWSFGRR
jgi:hypothetical protein